MNKNQKVNIKSVCLKCGGVGVISFPRLGRQCVCPRCQGTGKRRCHGHEGPDLRADAERESMEAQG